MSAPCEYAIEAAGLVKTYDMGVDRVHALRGVDFRVGKGEFWAIMGASGSGKSTMLQILGCLDRPTAGSYRLEGREVSGLGDDELSTCMTTPSRVRRTTRLRMPFQLSCVS